MEINRETYLVLLACKNRMRRLRSYWMYAKWTIVNNHFNVNEWYETNQNEFLAMERFLSRYNVMSTRNEGLINQYRIFHFYWHHVIDCFVRETGEWRSNNLNFIDERIEQSDYIENLFHSEMMLFRNENASGE